MVRRDLDLPFVHEFLKLVRAQAASRGWPVSDAMARLPTERHPDAIAVPLSQMLGRILAELPSLTPRPVQRLLQQPRGTC